MLKAYQIRCYRVHVPTIPMLAQPASTSTNINPRNVSRLAITGSHTLPTITNITRMLLQRLVHYSGVRAGCELAFQQSSGRFWEIADVDSWCISQAAVASCIHRHSQPCMLLCFRRPGVHWMLLAIAGCFGSYSRASVQGLLVRARGPALFLEVCILGFPAIVSAVTPIPAIASLCNFSFSKRTHQNATTASRNTV